MKRQYSWPEGHWNWPVQLTHQHGVRAGQMIYTGGQVDLDPLGNVRNPGDVTPQCSAAMAYMALVLEELGAGLSDLVRLIVYYVGDAETEQHLLTQIADIIGHDTRPVINMIGLPELCYPQMMIEIEGIAMRGRDGAYLTRTCLHLEDMPALPKAYSHVVTCGEMVFTSDLSAVDYTGQVDAPGDVQAQTQIMMDRLGQALASVGADYADVLKLNVFYTGNGTAADWEGACAHPRQLFSGSGSCADGNDGTVFSEPRCDDKNLCHRDARGGWGRTEQNLFLARGTLGLDCAAALSTWHALR